MKLSDVISMLTFVGVVVLATAFAVSTKPGDICKQVNDQTSSIKQLAEANGNRIEQLEHNFDTLLAQLQEELKQVKSQLATLSDQLASERIAR